MSNAQKISGVLFKVLPPEEGMGKKGKWVKQSFIIETKDQYPKKVLFTAWKDNCDLIPQPGTEVTVSYNPESREYNGKWYTDLTMWAIDVAGSKKAEKKEPVKSGFELKEEDQDLPF